MILGRQLGHPLAQLGVLGLLGLDLAVAGGHLLVQLGDLLVPPDRCFAQRLVLGLQLGDLGLECLDLARSGWSAILVLPCCV